MIENLGLVRVEKNPEGEYRFRYYYEDKNGHRISKEEYAILNEGDKKKKVRKKKEKIMVPYPRQKLWNITKDTSSSSGVTLVFLRYAKSVPLEEWTAYKVYDGPYFSKK